ncbi:sporulation histidine kinase inhibitor Sda [Paenibacillus xanthanilyticus]|uniref:Sporulation histidine kinase inhibitor Sda n=1 Tax=Paenibacillus xanthanilyticus TaxID=1783531 RepID=A0ABV8K017_9BACL
MPVMIPPRRGREWLLGRFSDEAVLETYREAKALRLERAFIGMLARELRRRRLALPVIAEKHAASDSDGSG